MTEIDTAFEAAKAAKIEIARIEREKREATETLRLKREELAKLEAEHIERMQTIEDDLDFQRRELQRALQKINDAPIETNPVDEPKVIAATEDAGVTP